MRRTMMVISLMAVLLAAGPVSAAPTVQLTGGFTSVELSSDFVGALGALGVEASAIGPASLRRGVAAFPIPGGGLDLATAAGDIFHNGGLALRAGATHVQLLNFVIDTQAAPVLTGLVVVNGDLVGRIPLFDLSLTQGPYVRRNYLVVPGVEATLTGVAADALDDVFGVEDFEEGLLIGEAAVHARFFAPKKSKEDKQGDRGDRDDD